MPDLPVRFTEHALQNAARYNLDLDEALAIVRSPQQVVTVREFRQSRIGEKLLRVLVELTRSETVVVTMYGTNKIEKYWQR